MKRKDKSQFREMSIDELRKTASELSQNIKELSIKHIVKPLKNVRTIKVLRQKKAIILSILNEKERKNEK